MAKSNSLLNLVSFIAASLVIYSVSSFCSFALASDIETANRSSTLEVSQVNSLATDQYINDYFGNVQVNSSSSSLWKISNKSTDNLDIKKIVVRGSMFSARTDCPDTLKPQEACRILIYFSPSYPGYHTGQLDVIFSEGGNFYFNLSGNGVQ